LSRQSEDQESRTATPAEVKVPPAFEYGFERLLNAKEAAERDPGIHRIVIKLAKGMLRLLSEGKNERFRATLLNEMGLAYANLPTGDRGANLERAIACYTEALRVFTPEATPIEYSKAQNNLGNAYANLPGGDRGANLERAIAYYSEALRFLSPEAAQLDYAMTQSNLGNAHAELPTGDRGENLERAIGCYTEALRFLSPEAAPLDYAGTQHNLGSVYADLPTGDRGANLERAIACYMDALRFRTRKATPREYAETQGNLGNAYADLPNGDREANLKRAIACYTEALRVFTRKAAPREYAKHQNSLGFAYASLPNGNREENLERAIACYTEALGIFTPEAAPNDHRRAAVNLGLVHFSEFRWEEAHVAFASALRAADLLHHVTAMEAGRQAVLEKARYLAAHDAYCLARLGRITEAVERLESGRVRALSEALARDRAALDLAAPEDREAFSAARDRIKGLEIEARAGTERVPGSPVRSFLELSDDLAAARRDLQGVVDHIRGYVPEFMVEGLDYRSIAEVSTPERPLVYLIITTGGSLALVVPAGDNEPGAEDCLVWLDGFGSGDLDRLLVERGTDGEVVGGLLVGQVTGDLEVLSAALQRMLPDLRDRLMGPLTDHLRALGFSEAVLVSAGRLSLLPLPAAAGEGLTLSLAPSARTLQTATTAPGVSADLPLAFVGVGNPLPVTEPMEPLDFAEAEVNAVATLFTAGHPPLVREQATREALLAELPVATHLHLACHGAFDPDEPLDSALYLGGQDRLTLRDLLDGDLDLTMVRLAVLSACQTGITEFLRVPDEAIGLPAGFLQAGVPGVVSTLWPVNDISSAVLVAEFYRLLIRQRLAPAEALGRAQRYVRDSTPRELGLAEWFDRAYSQSGGADAAAFELAAAYRADPDADPPFNHPFYWAGFTYTGA